MVSDSDASDPDEPLSNDALSEVLAQATGTTPEEIKRGAEAIEIEPPEDAEVVSKWHSSAEVGHTRAIDCTPLGSQTLSGWGSQAGDEVGCPVCRNGGQPGKQGAQNTGVCGRSEAGDQLEENWPVAQWPYCSPTVCTGGSGG